jgi:hypothetical protein
MQLVESNLASTHFPFPRVGMFPKVPTNPGVIETNLSEMRIDDLRDAIRANQVTFPSQVPTFPKHDRPDLQRKLVQLYFVLGWSGPTIGVRYGLRRLRVQQILNAWKRRAVELGYIQSVPPVEIFTRPLEYPPIRVVLSPVLSSSSAPIVQPSTPASSSFQGLSNTDIPKRTDPQRGHRPRSRFDISQIVSVLEQLGNGRTVAEMANEVGVSAYTIRIWKDQHEIHLLRHQNAQLKARLARLNEVEKTLIDVITRSNNASLPSFMPFSRVSSHTETDYRESL